MTARRRDRPRAALRWLAFPAALAVLAGQTRAAGGGDADAGLNLADLAPYRAALENKPGAPAALPATFRDLWEHPDRYQGKRVRVEGRVARRFRQGAFGTFPPLTEVWAVSPAGDPLCLVFPASPGAPDSAPGASVRFEGTFLRRLRYQGGDAARLAPLIVGDRAPTVTSPAPPSKSVDTALPVGNRSRVGWALGLSAAVLAALALARRHLLAPYRPPRSDPREEEPPPEFVDPA